MMENNFAKECLNDDLGLTLTFLISRLNMLSVAFIWENVYI